MPWNKITTQGYLSEMTVYSNVQNCSFQSQMCHDAILIYIQVWSTKNILFFF